MEGLTLWVESNTRKRLDLTPKHISLIYSKYHWDYGKTCSETEFNFFSSKVYTIINSDKLSFVLNHTEEDLTISEFYYVGNNTLVLSFDPDSFYVILYNHIFDVRRYVGSVSGTPPNYSSEPMDDSERILLLNRINKHIKEYLKDD